MIDMSTKAVQDIMRREDERELFEALDIGLQTAAAAAKAIALGRTEGRWMQISLLVHQIKEKCSILRHGKRLAPLQLPDNAKPVKDFIQ